MTSVTDATSTSTTTNTSSTSNSLSDLDLDTFLQLMLVELQNQDPLSPMENDKLLTQISQLREGRGDRQADRDARLGAVGPEHHQRHEPDRRRRYGDLRRR